jgi:DNA-binding GntR family transcriptional regulator
MAVARTSRVDEAYLNIRQRIVRGSYPPGAPLPEPELARACGISRTPIREALCRLQEEGYVERIPGRGFSVARITVKVIQDTFEVRRLLEAQASACAAERHDLATLQRLRRLAPIPSGLGPAARKAAQEANTRFHLAVAEAAGNSVLLGLIQDCLDQVDRFMSLGISLKAAQRQGTAEHLAIVEAIGRRDAEAASQAMEHHLDDCRSQYMQALVRGERQKIAV